MQFLGWRAQSIDKKEVNPTEWTKN